MVVVVVMVGPRQGLAEALVRPGGELLVPAEVGVGIVAVVALVVVAVAVAAAVAIASAPRQSRACPSGGHRDLARGEQNALI